MSEATTTATTVEIFEPPSSNVARHAYRVRVTGADGAPVAGADVSVRMEGSGSLAPNFSSTEIRRETNVSGETLVTWYRLSIYDRDVKARVTFSVSQPDCRIAVEETQPETSNTSYNLTTRKRF